MRKSIRSSGTVLGLLLLIVSTMVGAATPLELAAGAGDVGTAKQLIALGVDVNGVDKESNWERTPLIRAAMNGRVDMVNLLLDSGANSGAVDLAGASALRKAVQAGHVKVVEALLKGMQILNTIPTVINVHHSCGLCSHRKRETSRAMLKLSLT